MGCREPSRFIDIGPGITRPVLVKNRDTSLPRSARRAMTSASFGFGFPGLLSALHRVPGSGYQVRLMSVSMVCRKMLFTRV